jgi:hypothetical protein
MEDLVVIVLLENVEFVEEEEEVEFVVGSGVVIVEDVDEDGLVILNSLFEM